MNAFITSGAKTDHGGIVVEADHSFLIDGKAIHLEGMKHYCPKCKVMTSAISLGKGFFIVGTSTAIMAGDKTTCGATFLPNQSLAVRESGKSIGRNNAKNSTSTNNNFADVFDEQIVAVDHEGNFIPNTAYYIKSEDGQIFNGYTDSEGKTPRIITNSANDLEIWLGDDAEFMMENHKNG
ncbi:PAAR domain-containing protein [Acinetobacter nematophilus]|uniref:PAAR domain-containing protein n=1 Tax=Acinetobacter nematophilus TaxID=2994642 RepID=A0A9X3DVG2_9GAMM|nr:PAAR domain-containing protein [Acinetobacter nematophilus]MCX5468841.1 PAAR domain-containing protein [Acinetobacter nematophilus]